MNLALIIGSIAFIFALLLRAQCQELHLHLLAEESEVDGRSASSIESKKSWNEPIIRSADSPADAQVDTSITKNDLTNSEATEPSTIAFGELSQGQKSSQESTSPSSATPSESQTQSKSGCKQGFYGHKCEAYSLCLDIIIAEKQLTGQQVCHQIGRECQLEESDKYLRCICDDDEYFLYLSKDSFTNKTWIRLVEKYVKDNELRPLSKAAHESSPNYIARCIKVDKCVGVRCQLMSEVCREGACVCNENGGYIRDPKDGQCKLLDACLVSGSRPCGQADCVATYDRDLYQCVCPPGYRAHQSGFKNSTICLDVTARKIPLLNKCEHECSPVEGSDECKCTCLDGYKAGSVVGVNEHKCYYIDDLNYLSNDNDITMRMKAIEDSLPSKLCAKKCETNEICIINEHGVSTCTCQRMGFDRLKNGSCVDWCTAAWFEQGPATLLDGLCLSGLCRIATNAGLYDHDPEPDKQSLARLEIFSSPRPTFECDCSTSPLIFKDSQTRLCKVNFSSMLATCQPGGIGYEDCVVNKTAYCSVLHRRISDLVRVRGRPADGRGDDVRDDRSKGKNGHKMEPYACVCSPEKKLLVDQPRNRSKCVKECDLYNNECVRFNRMCRQSTFRSGDFMRGQNLVREELGDSNSEWRINIVPTRCECLPGFSSNETDELLDGEADLMNMDQDIDMSSTLDQQATFERESNETAKHMKITSSCLLDYDAKRLVDVAFKVPANFDPFWLKRIEYENGLETRLASENNRLLLKETILNSLLGDSWWQLRVLDGVLLEPVWMLINDTDTLHEYFTLIGLCEPSWAALSIDAYRDCVKYRYWQVHKLRKHFSDWRRILTQHLNKTFFLMKGNVRVHVDICRSVVKDIKSDSCSALMNQLDSSLGSNTEYKMVDADLICNLTLHTASENSDETSNREINLEKQFWQFIFKRQGEKLSSNYSLMAPNMLIFRETVDNLNDFHHQHFEPCKSSLDYCGNQTADCKPVDSRRFSCSCKFGYTPIGSRDISFNDSKRDVCEDINECLFGACKEVDNISKCVNIIGDYRCECSPGYVGDGKNFCKHACDTISCKHGLCKLLGDHHATCECHEGYTKNDCSVLDPSVALRKANIIICGSIFTSVLLLAITIAFSQNRRLKKMKKEMKKMESEQYPFWTYETHRKQPQKHRNKKGN